MMLTCALCPDGQNELHVNDVEGVAAHMETLHPEIGTLERWPDGGLVLISDPDHWRRSISPATVPIDRDDLTRGRGLYDAMNEALAAMPPCDPESPEGHAYWEAATGWHDWVMDHDEALLLTAEGYPHQHHDGGDPQ